MKGGSRLATFPDLVGRTTEDMQRRSLILKKRVMQTVRARFRTKQQRQIVFIGGVQRSGTNMLMSALERSYDTDVFHESDSRAFDEFVLRPVEVLHRLVDLSLAPCVMFKALCDLQSLSALLDEFAPARALWIVRDYNDMVNSHLRTWSGCHVTIRRIVADRDSAAWRGRGMSDATHALVSQRYHPDINDDSAVALFWYFRNVLFFEQGLDRDPRVLALSYESLVQSPDHELRRVFDFLDLDFSHRVAAGVHSASVRKHHAPDIDQPIREICENLAMRFNELLRHREANEPAREPFNAASVQ